MYPRPCELYKIVAIMHGLCTCCLQTITGVLNFEHPPDSTHLILPPSDFQPFLNMKKALAGTSLASHNVILAVEDFFWTAKKLI